MTMERSDQKIIYIYKKNAFKKYSVEKKLSEIDRFLSNTHKFSRIEAKITSKNFFKNSQFFTYYVVQFYLLLSLSLSLSFLCLFHNFDHQNLAGKCTAYSSSYLHNMFLHFDMLFQCRDCSLLIVFQ